MKPGLRKIAALILASATLFGGGVLSASTAYADDTTLDTSTQLQAEPDTQTTMGGDVSETTPDNGSDNEAGTDTDNQSDDTTPQTNVGQAAPDVTIHDMLDTDSATVSKLKLTGWTTGTAPFDKDNERGDDKDDNNAIVRSYDTVTYDYDYTLTPDDAMTYYRKARVGFRFELPYPSNKVTFATDQMNWVDQTPGYTAKVTQEGDRQVFTAYRLLTSTSNSPTVCPGTSSITLAVKVLGASNGYRFHPTVKAWTVPNDTSNRIVSDTPKDVTVSAKLSLNVRMVNYGINDRGVFDYSVRERNTGAAGVKYDGHYAAWTVTVTDDNSGQLKANVTNPSETEGRFVNSYSSQPASITPKARKTLANPSGTLRLLNADEFTFELQDANGKTLQSKANKADGTVTFDKITYDTVGEHDYRIIEQSGKLAGITYDQTVHMMHVTVADNGYGQLKATVTYDDGKDTPVFTNTYNPKDATVTLTAHKTFGNANNSHAKLTDFQFQLFDNEQAVGVPVQTVNADRNGDVRFQPLTFTASQLKGNKSKTFTYTVREIRQSAGGVNYDSHMGMWQITVTDDLTGQLKAQTRTNAAYPTTFTNTYQAKPVSVQFRAHKTLNDPDHTGIQLQAGQYEFKCVEDKTGGQAGTVKTNDQQGNILFDTISYTKTGVYDYTLSEVHGDKGGITYDATKHHVKVTVTDNGEGQLLADVKYDGGEAVPEFTNSYKAQPATDTLNAVKTVTASEGNHYKLKGDDFTFALHRVTAPNGVTAEADQTKANDAQGNIRFDQLSFPLPGTYVYTVSERDTTVPGITKDGTVTTITYTVKDVDHAGRLKVVDKTITRSDGKTANGIRFDNTYNPKGVGYTLGGVKTIIKRIRRPTVSRRMASSRSNSPRMTVRQCPRGRRTE